MHAFISREFYLNRRKQRIGKQDNLRYTVGNERTVEGEIRMQRVTENEKREPIVVVSACLLGEKCKYNGGDNYSREIEEYIRGEETVSLCPEVLGGLPTPREPAEIVEGEVIRRDGISVDAEFRRGVEEAIKKIGDRHVKYAILRSGSPSCGTKEIYDGSFTGKLIPGCGLFARALAEKGIQLLDSGEIEAGGGKREAGG